MEIETIKRNLPRDLFLHLFNMVALYWFAISFITLCWQYVNYFFPDTLNYNYGFSFAMRFALASLFVVFPLFILTSWMLAKIYQKELVVRESKIRKWLIYVTLFVASLVLMGDLIFILNTFFNGEITTRFALKALSVIVVVGVIFGYYLDDVKKPVISKQAKFYAFGVSAVTILMVIGAFFIVGSPTAARLAVFDQQRVYDLQGIQGQILNYWQRKEVLPATLADLTDSISGYVAPTDPETKASYEYYIKNAETLDFKLCAVFKTNNLQSRTDKSMPVYPEGGFSQNWDHGTGLVCFDRKIDKTLYPPIKSMK